MCACCQVAHRSTKDSNRLPSYIRICRRYLWCLRTLFIQPMIKGPEGGVWLLFISHAGFLISLLVFTATRRRTTIKHTLTHEKSLTLYATPLFSNSLGLSLSLSVFPLFFFFLYCFTLNSVCWQTFSLVCSHFQKRYLHQRLIYAHTTVHFLPKTYSSVSPPEANIQLTRLWPTTFFFLSEPRCSNLLPTSWCRSNHT